MSRVEKFGRRNAVPAESRSKNKNKKASKHYVEDNNELPSRREAHPSNKQQMTKWFFRLVIGLFVLLMIGLLIWGRQYS
ncbi:hypothetical protein [Paenibacillus albus]|uniref:Uncharacterized protein n=1 Tax=Paenibacillus albus TaxID=2495582 RepID=A0A3S9A4R9_9BACL|nr:hypothetical protein [Paenibacillus albus]AZN40691.1 hypothetical protein EJC50_14265 [Paenibacillus albus]